MKVFGRKMKYSDEPEIRIHFIDEAPDYLSDKALTLQKHRQERPTFQKEEPTKLTKREKA